MQMPEEPYCIAWASLSYGVSQPSVLRGRALSSAAILSTPAWILKESQAKVSAKRIRAGGPGSTSVTPAV